MNTIEYDIELKITDFIRQRLQRYEVVNYSTDMYECVIRAKKNQDGLLVVAHGASPAEYTFPTENPYVYQVELRYIVTILLNDRRDRKVIYEILDEVRNILFDLELPKCRTWIVRHIISPQKFPDIQDGVHLAELELGVLTEILPTKEK